MEYCAPRGIPHSQFLRWDPDDQDKALGWLLDQAVRCPRCGTYPEDWLDEDGRPYDPPPMYAHSRRCIGCATIGREEDTIREFAKEDKANLHGLVIYLTSEPPAEPDPDEFEEEA